MKHCSIDLETLDNCPGGVILSIGAVMFDEENLGPRYYTPVSVRSCKGVGLKVSDDTLAWWSRQSPEARAVLNAATEPFAPAIHDVLIGFGVWLEANCPERDKNGKPAVHVWGNGADFDNAFLQCAYRAIGRDLPWNFWRNESLRTLKNNFGKKYTKLAIPEREGTHHNALDDAVHQARMVQTYLRYLDVAESVYETATLAAVCPNQVFTNGKTAVQMRYDMPQTLADAVSEALERGYAGLDPAVPGADQTVFHITDAHAGEHLHSKGIAEAEAAERTVTEFTPTHASLNSDGSVSLGGFATIKNEQPPKD